MPESRKDYPGAWVQALGEKKGVEIEKNRWFFWTVLKIIITINLIGRALAGIGKTAPEEHQANRKVFLP